MASLSGILALIRRRSEDLQAACKDDKDLRGGELSLGPLNGNFGKSKTGSGGFEMSDWTRRACSWQYGDGLAIRFSCTTPELGRSFVTEVAV